MSIFVGWDPPHPGWICAECGFVYDDVDPTTVADALAATGKRFRAPLTRGLRNEDLEVLLRTRPEPGHWSALEYACHVRDCLALYGDRVGRVLAEDKPAFEAMGRGELAVNAKYNEQDPTTVGDEIDIAATSLVDRLRSVPADAWQWVGTREGKEISVDWMARNVKHEVDHHLLDIGRTLRHARGR